MYRFYSHVDYDLYLITAPIASGSFILSVHLLFWVVLKWKSKFLVELRPFLFLLCEMGKTFHVQEEWALLPGNYSKENKKIVAKRIRKFIYLFIYSINKKYLEEK